MVHVAFPLLVERLAKAQPNHSVPCYIFIMVLFSEGQDMCKWECIDVPWYPDTAHMLTHLYLIQALKPINQLTGVEAGVLHSC